jgi:hypothetical protein
LERSDQKWIGMDQKETFGGHKISTDLFLSVFFVFEWQGRCLVLRVTLLLSHYEGVLLNTATPVSRFGSVTRAYPFSDSIITELTNIEPVQYCS